MFARQALGLMALIPCEPASRRCWTPADLDLLMEAVRIRPSAAGTHSSRVS